MADLQLGSSSGPAKNFHGVDIGPLSKILAVKGKIFQIGLLIMNQCGTGFAHIKLVKKGKSRMTAKRYTILVSSTRKIVLAIAQWSLINARKIPFIGLYLLEF